MITLKLSIIKSQKIYNMFDWKFESELISRKFLATWFLFQDEMKFVAQEIHF